MPCANGNFKTVQQCGVWNDGHLTFSINATSVTEQEWRTGVNMLGVASLCPPVLTEVCDLSFFMSLDYGTYTYLYMNMYSTDALMIACRHKTDTL